MKKIIYLKPISLKNLFPHNFKLPTLYSKFPEKNPNYKIPHLT